PPRFFPAFPLSRAFCNAPRGEKWKIIERGEGFRMTLYLRPLSLVYGPDARQAIEARRGGALGGSDFIAFTEAELIERKASGISPRAVSYDEARGHRAPLDLVEQRRADFAGLAMGRPKLM